MNSARSFVLLGLLVLATCAVPDAPGRSESARGTALYAQHCAVCHGADGNADTVVADLLVPRPAPFRSGLFKLVSTSNGVPTEDDLVQTLRRGMPGSTMMSWGWMPEEDLRELAREVQELAVRGIAASLHRTAVIAKWRLSLEEATVLAKREFFPGPAVDAEVTHAEGEADEGRRLFVQYCAACHGADGRGLPGTKGWQTGSLLWPRDLTNGYLRGGGSTRDLAVRVRAGMPGAHMPPTSFSNAQLGALVRYVESLVPEGAADRHVQLRRTVPVERRATLPRDDDSAAFQALASTRLPLAPLRWRAEACTEVSLRVAHDGNDLVVRLEWADASRGDRPKPDGGMGDGAAIQFTRATDPPLFAMGDPGQPVNVWRWHAYDPRETAGMLDLFDQPSHVGLDVRSEALGPHARSESLQLGGIASVQREAGIGLPLQVATAWHDGRWTATFRRSLRARSAREVDLQPGAGPVLFALAIWDGKIDPHAGSKAITTWHVLDVRP